MKNNIELNIDLIIEEYNSYVFTVVKNIAGDTLPYQDIEEIIADTFYLLWKNQAQIHTDMKSYLASIARNCTYNKLKHNKIYLEYDDQIFNNHMIKEYDFNQLLMIEEKMKRLSLQEKQIFYLYYVQGYKVKEIAKMQNLKTSHVKVKLYRIRKKLKEGKSNESN